MVVAPGGWWVLLSVLVLALMLALMLALLDIGGTHCGSDGNRGHSLEESVTSIRFPGNIIFSLNPDT
ncbi:hypothetical protein Pcinc_033247 [Petrolisthes cinctipes]|uniref:Uncharacterized protein n=1 Tax=Petrolisthes cinctipes TaxID=88211 RepID=A0AAE1ESY0_PETCI|nr:hypothetical protein Pcinc_033247 [Petrolisthes cinctipes]